MRAVAEARKPGRRCVVSSRKPHPATLLFVVFVTTLVALTGRPQTIAAQQGPHPIYSGTHSGGGTVSFKVTWDWSAIYSFSSTTNCNEQVAVPYNTLAGANRQGMKISYRVPGFYFVGEFTDNGRKARGEIQHRINSESGQCDTRYTWEVSLPNSVQPPPAIFGSTAPQVAALAVPQPSLAPVEPERQSTAFQPRVQDPEALLNLASKFKATHVGATANGQAVFVLMDDNSIIRLHLGNADGSPLLTLCGTTLQELKLSANVAKKDGRIEYQHWLPLGPLDRITFFTLRVTGQVNQHGQVDATVQLTAEQDPSCQGEVRWLVTTIQNFVLTDWAARP